MPGRRTVITAMTVSAIVVVETTEDIRSPMHLRPAGAPVQATTYPDLIRAIRPTDPPLTLQHWTWAATQLERIRATTIKAPAVPMRAIQQLKPTRLPRA